MTGVDGLRIEVRGTVQGVGFRPWVVRLARGLGVSGGVWNDAAGVVIEAFSAPPTLDRFLSELRAHPPPAARLTEVTVRTIPGEEVKTDGQGEVIGLFLEEEIPRGLSFADTLAAIREQGGLVYLPHPFDRMHAIPDPATLHRHLAEIDVLEVFNARLLRDSFNDEALRFARKYRLLQGAGSDAHVLQGVGTGAVRMRRFDGPEEFLLSLRTAEILRRPKSLAYLQSLKWVAQARDRLAPSPR